MARLHPLISLRFISLVPVVFGAAGAVLMAVVGAAKSVKAFRAYFWHVPLTESPPLPPHLDFSDQAIISVVESVDAFLISMVLLVFAVGTYSLFIGEVPSDRRWSEALQVRSISKLKQVLMEVIMVILAVLFLRELLLFESQQLYWEMLVVPITIALIALSLKWVGWKS